MTLPTSSTTTEDDSRDSGRAPSGSSHAALFLICEADRPLAGGAIYPVQQARQVVIGRGAQRAARLSRSPAGTTLTIEVPDQRISKVHLIIERIGRRWLLKDTGTRNGTFVDGRRVDSGPLAGESILTCGRTFFSFRQDAKLAEVGTSSSLSEPGLATLVPELHGEFARLARVAQTDIEVVIEGESGTGKELAARAIHSLSGRSGPFVAVNCGSVPETLFESQLFGHERGAYSGASERRTGLVRQADGGTLFLDEICELPASSQASLLRMLQEGEVLPLGSSLPVSVNTRIICATNRDVEQAVERGAFRGDLYARLKGYTLRLPPLRQRRVDLGLLIAALLPRINPDSGAPSALSTDAVLALLRYPWPYNIRELEKVLRVACALAGDSPIRLHHLPEHLGAACVKRRNQPVRRRKLTGGDAERKARIETLLEQHQGNVSAVARSMKKGRTQILRWIDRYMIAVDRYR